MTRLKSISGTVLTVFSVFILAGYFSFDQWTENILIFHNFEGHKDANGRKFSEETGHGGGNIKNLCVVF